MTLPNHWMTAEGSATIVFPFLTIQGALVPSQPTADREVRPGVDGIGLWKTGNRGQPFQIETSLDCVSLAAAGTAYVAYLTAIHTKKDLYYCGLLWGTVVIHAVTLVGFRTFEAGVGGVQGFSGAAGTLLTAQWTIETLDL